MRKRMIVLCLMAAMAITSIGCGNEIAEEEIEVHESESGEMNLYDGSAEDTDTKSENVSEAEKESEDADTADADEDEADPADAVHMNTNKETADFDVAEASDACKFVWDMKIGWNLGNTFDAYSDEYKVNELDFESYWCKTVTTKEMIDAIKAAGFQTMRMPVSWHNHVSQDGNYTISEVWMNRVQEVVDYAIDNDMYVIINIHHDNSTDYMYPSREYLEQSKTYVAAVWSQVAERFADYDEHLIMESLNEPRLVGTNHEWWLDGNNQECTEAVQCINELNQVFVDTVRASGGNNKERYLLVPGYCASLDGATNEHFALPQDIEGNENKILLEVHAYIPYHFALQGENESGSTDQWSSDKTSDTSEIDSLMDKLYQTYVKNGTGVVIDEFGARDKGGNIEVRTDFAAYYVEAARKRGITCCLWDNNVFSGDGEKFGIFRRSDCQFPYPDLVEGMMKAVE